MTVSSLHLASLPHLGPLRRLSGTFLFPCPQRIRIPLHTSSLLYMQLRRPLSMTSSTPSSSEQIEDRTKRRRIDPNPSPVPFPLSPVSPSLENKPTTNTTTTPAALPAMVYTGPNIILTPEEEQVRQLLTDVAAYIDANPLPPSTVNGPTPGTTVDPNEYHPSTAKEPASITTVDSNEHLPSTANELTTSTTVGPTSNTTVGPTSNTTVDPNEHPPSTANKPTTSTTISPNEPPPSTTIGPNEPPPSPVNELTPSPVNEHPPSPITDTNDLPQSTITDEPLTLRFTGGWVRDKLLHGQSNDIDVGINKMTGYDFGIRMAEFLEEHGEKYNIPARGIHKIESNPEKSKHLETATTRILGLCIDLVNLRSEAYSENSRIPQMEFGTPVQDALRRDATVNALFYNLHTKEVEDFTERGLRDLKLRVMRTPLQPFETFKDDPLRVLRLIRFASRLGFEIVEEVEEAMRDPEIKKALQSKISRERIGTEVNKMLSQPTSTPHHALSLIQEMSLFTCIFTPTDTSFCSLLPTNPTLTPCINALRYLLYSPTATTDFPNLHKTLTHSPHRTYHAWIIAAVSPWANLTLPDSFSKKETLLPAAAVAAREGLKLNNKDYAVVLACYTNTTDIDTVVKSNETTPLSREDAGVLVREWGAKWWSMMHCGLLMRLREIWGEDCEDAPSAQALAIIKSYDVFIGHITSLGVEEAYDVRPVLNGKQLRKLFNARAGPWMKPVLEQLVRWQLRNPEGPEEEALEWVREWVGVEVANARLVIEKDVKADAKTEVGADVNADVKVEVGAEVRAEV